MWWKFLNFLILNQKFTMGLHPVMFLTLTFIFLLQFWNNVLSIQIFEQIPPDNLIPPVVGNGGGGGNSAGQRHPLDPLTGSEINATSTIIKSYRRGNWIFNYIALKEPAKSELLPYFLSDSNPPINSGILRRSFVVILDKDTNRAYEVVVNLDTQKIESWNAAPTGVTPTITSDEVVDAEAVARNDTTVQERCRRLGWTNMSLVNADAWAMGYVADKPQYSGKRLSQLFMYGRNHENDNQYAHPFDFLPIIDLLKRKIINIEELPTHDSFDANNKDGNVVPRREANFDPSLKGENFLRTDLKPVQVTQQGTSFTISGYEIKWQKYKMRLGFNGREGFVIHHVNYNDNGTRPLFYRMSVVEMFIPYGDPRPPYYRKHGYDAGQYGIGYSLNTLKPQVDCVGEVRFLDVVVHNSKGEAMEIPRAICVREEDAGILWKHTEFRTGKSSLVRSQRLAMTMIATFGNYDYIFTWNFYQDGTIELITALTGILSTQLLAVGATSGGHGHGSVVFPQINAQYHQHFFSLRLDPEIDGTKNSVILSDVKPGPGASGSAENPYGQGFTTEKTTLRTAGQARGKVDPMKSRSWLISNPSSKHPYTKEPVSWKLMPWASPAMYLQKQSPIHRQAQWMDFNTWVLPYNEDQIFPAGFYLNNSGLPEWVARNENANIEDTDIVIWHNFGITHYPRVEDFSVMPIEYAGIMLKPFNFFKENPSIDVPPPKQKSWTDY